MERGRRDGRKRVNVGVSGKTYLLYSSEEDLAMEDKLRPQNFPEPCHFTQVLDGFTATFTTKKFKFPKSSQKHG